MSLFWGIACNDVSLAISPQNLILLLGELFVIAPVIVVCCSTIRPVECKVIGDIKLSGSLLKGSVFIIPYSLDS